MDSERSSSRARGTREGPARPLRFRIAASASDTVSATAPGMSTGVSLSNVGRNVSEVQARR
jgi:hypothetical protein